MSGSGKHTLVVALNGENYPTWKPPCKMALVREGLWGFVSGTEVHPEAGTEAVAKNLARRDQTLATILLAVETSLFHLLGDPKDPAEVWEQLSTKSETVGSGPKPEQEEKTRKEEPNSNLGKVTATKMPCSSGKR